MKINLDKIKFRPELGNPEVTIPEMNKQVAGVLWRRAASGDVAKAKFAMRLFDAPGEIEINDEEKGFIAEACNELLYWAASAIRDAINA